MRTKILFKLKAGEEHSHWKLHSSHFKITNIWMHPLELLRLVFWWDNDICCLFKRVAGNILLYVPASLPFKQSVDILLDHFTTSWWKKIAPGLVLKVLHLIGFWHCSKKIKTQHNFTHKLVKIFTQFTSGAYSRYIHHKCLHSFFLQYRNKKFTEKGETEISYKRWTTSTLSICLMVKKTT